MAYRLGVSPEGITLVGVDVMDGFDSQASAILDELRQHDGQTVYIGFVCDPMPYTEAGTLRSSKADGSQWKHFYGPKAYSHTPFTLSEIVKVERASGKFYITIG